MKNARYLTYIILVALAFLLIGELCAWNTEVFYQEYACTTFYKPKEVSSQKMRNDIARTAKEMHVDVFVYQTQAESSYLHKTMIYGTEDVKERLAMQSQIKEQEYNSIFLGRHEVVFNDFSEIQDMNDFEEYYLIGNARDMDKFKAMLINRYAGKFPQEAERSVTAKVNVALLWGIVFSLMLLLRYYELILKKKEIALRMTMGESLSHLIAGDLAKDCGIYTALWLLLFGISGSYTTAGYHWQVSIAVFLIFLFCTLLLSAGFMLIDYRKVLKLTYSQKGILGVSYIYQAVSVVVLIFFMAGNLALIAEGIRCYQQRDFFHQHRQSSYVNFSYREDYEEKYGIDAAEKKVSRDFYQKMLQRSDVLQTLYLEKIEKRGCLLMNSGAKTYLHSLLPELELDHLENKVYFILPEGSSKEETAAVKETWEMYYNGSYASEPVSYRESAGVIALDGTEAYTSSLWKDPFIILNNMDHTWRNRASNLTYLDYGTMYRISDEKWSAFLEEEGNRLQPTHTFKTGVYEAYLHYWEMQKRGMKAGLVLLGITLLIEIILLKSIIRYEFTVNATEIILKKIEGYSFIARYMRIFVSLMVSSVIGMGGVVTIGILTDSALLPYSLAGGICMILIETILIAIYTMRMEHTYIQKLLKGGII